MIPQQILCMVFPNRDAMRSTKKTKSPRVPQLPFQRTNSCADGFARSRRYARG
jgi:hypothetical protein